MRISAASVGMSIWLLFALGASLLPGCGGASQKAFKASLSKFGDEYLYHYSQHSRSGEGHMFALEGWNGLLDAARIRRENPNESPEPDPADLQVFEQLRDAGLVVHWGTLPNKLRNSSSEFVLAYAPEALRDGGYVLMADGRINYVTGPELQAALEAQGSDFNR